MNLTQKIITSIWLPILASFIIIKIYYWLFPIRVILRMGNWIYFLCFLGTGVFLWFFWKTPKPFHTFSYFEEKELVTKKESTDDSPDDILKQLRNG